jgi:anti-sigma B factor antagonist
VWALRSKISMVDPFTLSEASLDGGTPVLEVHGELDLATAPRFSRRLLDAARNCRERLVVDLNEATFIDSTTIGVLLGATRQVERKGGRLVVVVGRSYVRGVIELMGLDRVLTLVDSREQALAPL